MPDEKDTTERAKELLVYGPIGLALYVRDTAPSFLRLFVARGRTELDQRRQTLGDHLEQARTMGESAATSNGPQILRLVSEGLTTLRERAEEALEALGVRTGDEATPDDRAHPDELTREAHHTEGPAASAPPPAPAPGPVSWAGNSSGGPDPVVASPSEFTSAGTAPNADELAIPAYDDLSASQVVDRLEGLGETELDAIRAYELGHRARNTVLGKIEQLAREH